MALAFMSLCLTLYESIAYRERLKNEWTQASELIAEQALSPLLRADQTELDKTASDLAHFSVVTLVCFYDSEFTILASSSHYTHHTHSKTYVSHTHNNNAPPQASQASNCPERPLTVSHRFTDKHLQIAHPIKSQDNTIGYLYIEITLQEIRKHIDNFLLFTLFVGCLIAGLIILLSAFMHRIISVPLYHLKFIAQKVAEKQDYSLKASKESEDEIGELVDAFNAMLTTIADQNRIITDQKAQLEHTIDKMSLELKNANEEVEAFGYSVSHDLREPLRTIIGFAQAMEEDYQYTLDNTAKSYLEQIQQAGNKMSGQIRTLLNLSRVSRQPINKEQVDLSRIAQRITNNLLEQHGNRSIKIRIMPDLTSIADEQLIKIALEHLLENAFKFTQHLDQTEIQFGKTTQESVDIYYVKDNGAGFDMRYSEKLFHTFQRLHSGDQFEGSGIGLATVARIIRRHHGKIWAQSSLNDGSTFYFTLFDIPLCSTSEECTQDPPPSLYPKNYPALTDQRTIQTPVHSNSAPSQ
ncbi:MAG: ATP-binding protein [Pseudomonadales bacterium]|nr:ATP-binding protein [Pseudomonadales bacterium]